MVSCSKIVMVFEMVQVGPPLVLLLGCSLKTPFGCSKRAAMAQDTMTFATFCPSCGKASFVGSYFHYMGMGQNPGTPGEPQNSW